MLLFCCRYEFLLLARDGYVSAISCVYVLHHLPEQRPVSTLVLQSVDKYIIMYHLMNDNVLKLIFRQIEMSAYTESEIRIYGSAVPCPSALESKLPE